MGSGDCRSLKLYFDPLHLKSVWDASTLPLTDPTAKLHHCHCWPQRFFRNNIAGPITGFFTGPIVGAWSGAELISDLLISAAINIAYSYSIIIQYTHAAVFIIYLYYRILLIYYVYIVIIDHFNSTNDVANACMSRTTARC